MYVSVFVFQVISNLDLTSVARQSAFPTLTAETLIAARLAGALGSFAGFSATTTLDVKEQIAGESEAKTSQVCIAVIYVSSGSVVCMPFLTENAGFFGRF